MATYNGGPYLAAQLASLAHQDRLPDELVISDDGSCDETEQVVKEFAATSPFPVIWLRNTGRRGYRRNVDFALAATIGDIILLADQDDVWLEQHVRWLVTPFEINSRLMVTAGDSEEISASGEVVSPSIRPALTPAKLHATNRARGAAQFRSVLGVRGVIGHSMAFRRAVVELASPLPSGWMHDEWIFLVGAAMGPILYVDETISRFRRYARELPAEYPREDSRAGAGPAGELTSSSIKPGGSTASSGFVSETTKWQNLLSRLKYAGPMLPYADRVLHDVSAQIRVLAFQASLRDQSAPVRAVRKLPWILTGRNPKIPS
jgi:glycosyltransferase involved in cell wall biosynthesis